MVSDGRRRTRALRVPDMDVNGGDVRFCEYPTLRSRSS